MPKTPRMSPIPISAKAGKGRDSMPEVRGEDAQSKVEEIDAGFASQRKLIRPVLPDNAAAYRDTQRRGFRGILTRRELTQGAAAAHDTSHAEAFYFQKQIQSQTQMVFVLEDGGQIEGVIEWYDRNCIKVRNNGRVLIYKSAIKYLFKASERNGDGPMTLV